MSLCEVNHIDVVADTCSVRCVIVIAEDGQLLADAHSGLSDVGNKVVGHSVRQLADFGRGMSTNRIEIAQNDALDGSTAVDVVSNDLLVYLLSVAVRRCGLLMRTVLCNGEVLRLRLTVNGAA